MQLEELNAKYPHSFTRRESIRVALQSRLISESRRPQIGLYWWSPDKNGPRLSAFFEEDYDMTTHDVIWRKYAATILGLNNIVVPKEVLEAYCGLPRGRVDRVYDKTEPIPVEWLIRHGNDTPKSGFDYLISRFNLPYDKVKTEYDEILTTDPRHVEIINDFLAIDT
jgi:hypothetical protein